MLYKHIVGPTLHRISPLLTPIIEAHQMPTAVDVFFWAVFMGDVRLARELWSHVEHPLHCALLASRALRVIHASSSAGRSECIQAAAEIEGWAIGVMDEVGEQELGMWLLSQPVEQWKMGSLIDIALSMDLKAFLCHRHCQSLMDLRWRGGYPGSGCVISAGHSMVALCIWAFVLPWCNPYRRANSEGDAGLKLLRRRRGVLFDPSSLDASEAAMLLEADEFDDAAERATAEGDGESDELVLGALAEALRLKMYERSHAEAAVKASEDQAKKAAEAKQKAAAAKASQGTGGEQKMVALTEPARDDASSDLRSSAIVRSLAAVKLRRENSTARSLLGLSGHFGQPASSLGANLFSLCWMEPRSAGLFVVV